MRIAALASALLVASTSPAMAQSSPGDYDKVASDLAVLFKDEPVRPVTNQPPTDGYEPMVRAWMQKNLRDPYSAVLTKVTGPSPTSFKPDVWTRIEGQAVCYDINAKNAYGGFAGVHRYLFVVSAGTISYQISTADQRSNSFADGIVRQQCGA